VRNTGLIAAVFVLAGCSMSADSKLAEQAVPEFHRMLDAEQFEPIYDAAASELKGAITRKEFTELLSAVHRKLGATKSSDQQGWRVNYNTSGTFVTLTCQTHYTEGDATEQFVYRLQGDKALLAGYNINSLTLITR
jgi:Protein of unknown function (DUF4019)